ncbi:MAG: hypothetical protein GXY95_03515 [Clostridiales bacterium]|jgi:hypothetical protein|nr:hypothetical protein [Clostridiales bacterium]HOA33507.1 hypothetical protein [Clostridiales bacterium]HPP67855.1 hypothetical protein [Clostridiales bacterium]HPU67383.1 hypothetical protein [Clostridiales bacterium]HQA05180.1 hypothetical protein [Clostridiales bacterium]
MKELFNELKKIINSMNSFSKNVIKYGSIPVIAVYALAAIMYIFAGRVVDYFFAMQICRDLLTMGKDFFSVIFVSALFFEIIATATGMKYVEAKNKDKD